MHQALENTYYSKYTHGLIEPYNICSVQRLLWDQQLQIPFKFVLTVGKKMKLDITSLTMLRRNGIKRTDWWEIKCDFSFVQVMFFL